MQLPRSSIVWTFVALVFLRIVVGLHFFHEGLAKIRSGSFDASPFLSLARGPAADFFHGLIDDHDGHIRLSVTSEDPFRVDPGPALAIWEDWLETVTLQSKFDSDQRNRANTLFAASKTDLVNFYERNKVEINAWLRGSQRLESFAKDGPLGQKTATEVDSLGRQVTQIANARRQTAAVWFNEIEAIWNNLEAGVNDIAAEHEVVALTRPWAPENSRLTMINRALPWFDLAVGVLLVLGLATRFAALAGMGLLIGILATQPFWVPGAVSTFYQWIEFAALFLLLVTGAGRFGGLDYFLTRTRNPASRAGVATS